MFYYWQIFSACLNRISRIALIFPIFILVSMWTAGIVIFISTATRDKQPTESSSWCAGPNQRLTALLFVRWLLFYLNGKKQHSPFRWEVEIWKKIRSESLVWLLFSVLGGCGFKTRRGNLWFCLLIFPASRDSRNTHFNVFLMVVIVIVKVTDICFTRFWDAYVSWRL